MTSPGTHSLVWGRRRKTSRINFGLPLVWLKLPQAVPGGSTAGDDLDDFQPVARVELALGKFRRRDCFAVVLYHHAARQKFLRHEEFLQGARQSGFNHTTIGDEGLLAHGFLKQFA